MARDRRSHMRQEGSLSAAPSGADVASRVFHLARIEAAMSKIARSLPHNPSLSAVWIRLEQMQSEAAALHQKETEVQMRAWAWLEVKKK